MIHITITNIKSVHKQSNYKKENSGGLEEDISRYIMVPSIINILSWYFKLKSSYILLGYSKTKEVDIKKDSK